MDFFKQNITRNSSVVNSQSSQLLTKEPSQKYVTIHKVLPFMNTFDNADRQKLSWKNGNSNGLYWHSLIYQKITKYSLLMKTFQSCHFWLCNEKDYLWPKSHSFIKLDFSPQNQICVFSFDLIRAKVMIKALTG